MRPTGASIIDHVLGGYPPGLPLVIAGPSGSGRTVLSLQLSNSALLRGEIVQIVSSEPAKSLMHQADALGFEFDTALAEERLVLLELDANTPSLVRAQGIESLVAALRAEASEASLVIIDPFTAITAEIVDEPRLREVSRAFVRSLAAETLVMTVETERLAQQRGLDRVLSEMCGAYLVLDREASGRRTLTVEKSRAGLRAAERVEFAVGPNGTHLVGDATPKAEIPLFTRVRRVPERRAQVVRQHADADLAAPVGPINPLPRQSREVPRRAPVGDALQPSLFPAPSSEPRTRSLILLVEDSRMQRELVSDWLAPRYDVITAVDGFEALAKIVSHHPDLVILDLIMPRVSGYELLAALRRAQVDVPVLVASSRVQTAGDRLRPLVLGATDFLAKPVNRLELEHKVETLLRLPRDSEQQRLYNNEAEALFGCVSASRLLEGPDFRDRLARACNFGERHGFASSLVRVDAPDAPSLDRFLDAADQELRFEDAILRVSKQRALVLLVATGPSDAMKVIDRLFGPSEAGDAGLEGFTLEALAATPEQGDPDTLELIATAAGDDT